MKRLYQLIFVAILIIIAGCGQKNQKASKSLEDVSTKLDTTEIKEAGIDSLLKEEKDSMLIDSLEALEEDSAQ